MDKPRQSDFSQAEIGWCVFADVDLTTAEGLAHAIHTGPSTIGTDTLIRCRGKVPHEFLRGAGVSDSLITYSLPPGDEEPQFYSCFISYSNINQDFAGRLYDDLQSAGVRCWFAPHDIKSGEKLHEQIEQAIRRHGRLLLILSEHSIASEWVKTEIANARQREVTEKRRMLFPISLVPYERITDWHAFDADTGKDSAREIREYYIPDFSNWKDRDSYAAAFQRLLRDFKFGGQRWQVILGVLQSENPKTTFWNGKLKTISGTVSRRWWRLRTRFAHVATILIGERDRAMCLLLLPDQLMNSFILAALPVN